MTIQGLIDGLNGSREFFLRHLTGLTPEQWDWKPFPEAMSVRETVLHLARVDDLGAVRALGGAPVDLDGLEPREAISRSNAALLDLLASAWSDRADQALRIIGGPKGAARGVTYRSMEDYYHAGQVAYIRQATDPSWDQDTLVYGDEE